MIEISLYLMVPLFLTMGYAALVFRHLRKNPGCCPDIRIRVTTRCYVNHFQAGSSSREHVGKQEWFVCLR